MKLENLKDKKILILGFGKEGKNTYKTLKKLFPKKPIAISDKNKVILEGEKIFFGEDYLKRISEYDVIIKTPGISYDIIKPYLKKNNIVTSQTELFLENCPGMVIGITGTKGKSTTTKLISHLLKTKGLKVKTVGNIGKPSLSYLLKAKPSDIFVYEMSCHQLDRLKKSPHIGVLLNLYEEHLDYYKTFKKYAKAKMNIAIHQEVNDFIIYNPKIEIKTKSHKIPFKKQKIKKEGFHEHTISAAVAVAKIFGLTRKEIEAGIESFRGLDSRLEYLGSIKGVKLYNDSLSTIPEATIFALNQLKDVDTLILGGKDRGINYDELIKEIKKRKIKNIVLFPETGDRIFKKIKNEKINMLRTESMKEAAEFCLKNTKKICLLSPAASSYNLFKNYKDRAKQFKKYLNVKK